MYLKVIKNFESVSRKRYKQNILRYNYIYTHFVLKKLINICTKKGFQQKTEKMVVRSLITLKQNTKKDISLVSDRSFALLGMLFGTNLEYSGTKKIIKGILLNNYQQYAQSINQFVKYMKTVKTKSLSEKFHKTLLELFSEKGYLFLEKKKKYISILKAAK